MGSLGAGVAGAGVALKSLRDWQQEEARFKQEQDTGAANLEATRQSNTFGKDKITELQRQRVAEAEERAATNQYYTDASPGYVPGQAPAQPAEAAPTEQPMPATAVPGATLSSSPVQPPKAPVTAAEAPVTPGGAPSLSAPARPAPVAPGAPAAQPAGGRSGLLDVLAQKAYARGDTARANQLLAQKNEMEKEGMAQVAHEAMMDPTNVKKIEEVSNQYGARRLVPGSLKYEGNGNYSGISIMPDGSQKPFQNFNMLHAAMSLGVIAPPAIAHFKTDENVYSRNPSTGKLEPVQEGHKFATAMNREGDIVTTNLQTGDTKVQSAGGGAGRLSRTDNMGLRQVMTLVGREASNRTNMDKDNAWREGYVQRPYDQANVAGVAQSLFLNNTELGKNAPLAVKIATAINDKDKDTVTGVAMLGGEQWNVVQYGTGKNRQLYGVSKVAQQPQGGTPAAQPKEQTAEAPAAAPARAVPVSTQPQAPQAAAPAPAPQSLPKPPPRVKSPEETAGGEVDSLRESLHEANSRLHDISATTLKRDPGAADRVRSEIAKLQAAHKAAMERYSSLVGSQAAVSGRAMRP